MSNNNKYVLEVKDLTKSFGDNHVIKGISLHLGKGESYVIIGGSGSGKSVLLKCILGIISPTSGQVILHGTNMVGLPPKEREKLMIKCGILFQSGALFDSLTVLENITFGLIYGYGWSKKDAKEVAIEKLHDVNLKDEVLNKYPSELSGGMQKRVALARAIATSPDIIFFDEPTTGLDPITSGIINELIVKCTHEIGISALSITHDINSLKHISDRVGLLFGGKLIWEGTNQNLWTSDNPYVQQFITGSLDGPFTT
ncbi:MAG: ATP-binding cassette domain-containing protein [Alphaproteobacteria bacterium]|nr:ATP-binding cassette domain-containing protein [Alphaproteobacteria bacterium]